MAGGVLALVIVCLLVGCGAGRTPASVPPELHGTWRTEARGYEDRFFTLSATSIAIGTGNGSVNAYPVRTLARAADGMLYSLSYVNEPEGADDTLFFYYTPENGGTIRFKNQANLVWKRT
jgi:hypothetical protein